MRKAAERIANWYDQHPANYEHPYHDTNGGFEAELADMILVSDYLRETIPANPTALITPEWLREVWGGLNFSGEWRIAGLTGTFHFDDDGSGIVDLLWVHTGNVTGVFTTRHQFTQLATALGLQPKGE